MIAGLPSIMREEPMHSASLGKDPGSKFEVRFLLNVYCFHTTVKLKNYKSNHDKAVVFNQFWILFKDKYIYMHMYMCVYVKYVIYM